MPEIALLRDLVVILAAAVVVVALLNRVGVPAIAGFIVCGALVGPNALGLVDDVHQVEMLAEVGVVLLLFGIGLELSLQRLRRLWRPVLVGGALQVGLTLGAVVALARLWDLAPAQGVFLGFVVAVSSTAIVLRGLGARGELDAPHGRLTLGILVFQDLSVVPMMLVIPLLAGASGSGWAPVIALGKAAGVLVFVLLVARLAAPRLLELVARTRQRELFVLAVLLICLGIAWGVSLVGVSLALGAFLGGMAVADSGYRHQALSDLIPLREALTSVFFVSVGMLFSPAAALRGVLPTAGLLLAIVAGKFIVVFLVAAAMRLPLRVCALGGASLAQVGEFSFVLSHAAKGSGLIPATVAPHLNAAVILSMLITPVAIALGPHIAAGMGRIRWLNRMLQVRTPADDVEGGALRRHVVIAGYGVTGRDLARALASSTMAVPYVIVDLNPENVRQAIREQEPAYFGDVTSEEVLEHLGLKEARALVVVINDPGAAERAIRAARRLAPDLSIVVRTSYVADVDGLRRAGASEVVAAEAEAGARVVERVLGDLSR